MTNTGKSGMRRDPSEVVRELREHYPQGLPGEREQLVTELMNRSGLEHKEAVQTAEAMQASGHAHHLPGDSGRWLFTSESVSMRRLMEQLDENYDGYVGNADEPRGEMLGFIGEHLGVGHDVAEEVLVGLEQSGYAAVAYQDHLARDRVMVEFPEAFRTTV